MVKTIRDNIAIRLLATLGSDYVKLSFGSDLSMNKFGRSVKRFAVIPKSAVVVVDGPAGANTIDHRFEIILTDGYVNGAAAQLNDDLKLEKIGELQDKALLIYKDLQMNKSSLNGQVLIVNGLNVSEIEYLDEEKVAVLKIEINIKYKV